MSADSQGDTGNLNKDEESPTTTHPEGIPDTSTVAENVVRGQTDTDHNTPPAAKANASINDNTEDNDEEIESIIEKKLPDEKEKGLDVDSELDFELKWDDDTDLNEDILGDTGKDIESTLTSIDEGLDSVSKNSGTNPMSIEKDPDDSEKDTESILTSIDEGLDSVTKDLETTTSDEKELDDEEKATKSIVTSKDEGLDSVTKDLETTTSDEKELDDEEKATKSILTSKDEGLDSVTKDLETSSISKAKDRNVEEKTTESILTFIDEALDSVSEDAESILTSDKVIDNAYDEMQSTFTSNIGLSVEQDKEIITSTEDKLDSAGSVTKVAMPSVDKDNALDKLDCKMDDDIDINTASDTSVMDIDKVAEETQSKPVDVLVHSDELKKTDMSGNEGETLNVVIVGMDLETKTSPTESEANSLDEQLVYSDVEAPDIEDKDLLDEIDAQITETNKSIDELEIKDTEKVQALTEPSISQKECQENETCQKDSVSEMDLDNNMINSTQLTEKSDLNDTCATATDMEASSYDINNEHGLDRPDVMLEIPTQELIESFDDSGETSDTAVEGKDKLEESVNVINKPDLIDSTTTKQNNQGLTESQTIGDKTIIAQSVSVKDYASKSTLDTLIKDKLDVDTNKSADNVAKVESMDVDTSATSEEINKLGQGIREGDANLETIKPIQEIVTADNEKLNEGDIILEANSEQPTESITDKSSPTEETEVNEEIKEKSSEDHDLKEIESKSRDIDVAQPSTSKDHQELSDEDQEVTDSLGLLAESSRIMDDEDEQEPEQEAEDDDDDDDFDQDDESNQMTAEHSEDSNAQHSESDVPKESMDIDESNDAAEPQIDDTAEIQDMEAETADDHEVYDEDSHVDESSVDKENFQIQIGGVVSEKPEIEAETLESVESAETSESIEAQNAVASLLEDKPAEEEESSDVLESAAKVEGAAKLPEDTDLSAVQNCRLRALLLKDSSDSSNDTSEAELRSPSWTKNFEISKPKHEINIVELEESSSEDDVQVYKQDQPVPSLKKVAPVDIPSSTDVSPTVEESLDTEKKEGELASDVQKPAPKKPAILDTDEGKTSPAAESPAAPETMAPKTPETKTPIDLGAEIFSLDSDDEDAADKNKRKKRLTAVEIDKARETNNCINVQCTSDASVPLVPASLSASVYYAANPQRGSGLCINCAQRFEDRSKKLIEGVKDLTPYLNMDMCMIREELVEISDSDSDDDPDLVKKDDEILGEKGAKILEEQLADMFNDTWKKYDMEARLLTAQTEVSVEVRQLEEECKKIDAMLQDCQTATDKLRNDLYDTFADERRVLPSISIFDTPTNQWSGLEEALPAPVENKESRQAKRRLPAPPEPTAKRPAIPLGYTPLDSDANKQPTHSSKPEPTAKRPAIPLGYAPLDSDANKQPTRSSKPEQMPIRPAIPLGYAPLDGDANKQPEAKPTQPPAEVPLPPEDDNADISVVKLSVEAAPAGLPPVGVATRPPLRPHMQVFAMRNTFGAWHKVRVVEVQPKVPGQFTMCRVRFEHPKNTSKVLPARCLAYEHAPDVRLTIGTRVVALFRDHRNLEDLEKKEAYYSGIVAEIPNPVNSFRYLIFFDDGYAQYVQHAVTRLVCECAPRVWDEVHPFSRQFVRDYLRAYPERPMVRLHAGQSIKTEWNGRWWPSKVLQVDASLVHVHFDGKKEAGIDKTEWIYRGSTRLAPLFLELQAAERQRSRPLPRAQAGRRFNMPYVEYTRSDETSDSKSAPPGSPAKPPAPTQTLAQTQAQIEQEIRRQRAVAKKSTAVAPPPQPVRENVTSRVVYYSPKNAIKPHKWVPHKCGPQCKRTDVLALKDLRTYNPLTKPLLSGWERHTLRFRAPQSKTAMYRAPCGRRIRNHHELHQYLQAIDSDMSVDLFDFNGHTHCLAEFVLNKCIVSKKDLSHGKENVPVPCVNYYDDSLPEFCSYNTERTPTAGVPLNLDPEFLCGCDCTDDCADKTKCACWKMTLEGAHTIGLDTDEVGYVYKRLPEPLPSGIYECNSRCKCRQTCLNRVAQHPLQLKLQVFKTANRGWGIRALNDVPKGAFLCVYAGNLLTDATANLDGLNEGDEYLAELDYIEVVEQMKEGFEEDIPDDAKKLDQEEDSLSSLSSDDEPQREADDDFRPALPTGRYRVSEYSKRLRKREKSKMAKEKEEKEKKAREEKEKNSEDCITISDDEELREPARFAARAGMGGKEFVSKHKSVRAHFGKDEACYIMDAKVQGNIGRYLNHSCTPNVFVQNVFVDTHDPRFPWVAFFALSHIKAGTELTWNYNYDVGSVPGKVLYCYCNAPNCRGRLL